MRRLPAIIGFLAALAPAARGDDLSAVAPLIDWHTVAVARVELPKFDSDALFDLVAPHAPEAAQVLGAARKVSRAWLDEYRKKGGRELYVVLGLGDFPGGPVLATPVNGDLERKDLGDLLRMLAPGEGRAHARIGNLVCVGPKAALERLAKGKPARRADLDEAFAAAGEGVVRVALTVPADVRRVFEETVDELPKEVGGGSIRTLTRGLKWAALSLDGPPKLRARAAVQAADEDAAARLSVLFARSVEQATHVRVPDDEPLSKVYPQLVRRVRELLTPKVEKDRLAFAADLGDELPGLMKMAQRAQSAADRSVSANNLKQLGIALHNYHDVHGHLPADVRDKDGKPLLSWRVHVLPYVEEQALYEQFKLDEPWDSEHNRKLIDRMPKVFRSPKQSADLKGRTTYLAPTGKGMIWDEPVRGKTFLDAGKKVPLWQGVRMTDITDGTSNTVLLVEADDDLAAVWTRPADHAVDAKDPAKGLWGHYGNVFAALLADGSVRMLPKKLRPEVIYMLFTRSGGEVVPGE